MNILLSINSIDLEDEAQIPWNLKTVDAFISCLEKLLVWDGFRYYTEKDSYFSIKNRAILKQYLVKWKGPFRIDKTLCFNQDSISSFIDINISARSIGILLSIKKVDYKGLEKQLIPNLKDFVLNVINAFPNVKEIGREISIDAFQCPFYKKRPPYYTWRWKTYAIVDIIDKKNLSKNKAAQTWLRNGLQNLPDFVDYKQVGDLHLLTWIDDISDEKAISKCLTERNKWLHQYMQLERDSSYNELGAKRDGYMYLDMDKHPNISYYDTAADYDGNFYGFQTMEIMPDGSTDEFLLNNLATWIKAGLLPNGSPINCLSLIVQDHSAAMLILERAKALGFYSVLYMDDNGIFWDVDPAGLWLN